MAQMKAGQEARAKRTERTNPGSKARETEEGRGGKRWRGGWAGRKKRSRTAKPGEEGKAPKPRQSPAPVVSGDGIMGNPGGNEKNPGKNNIFALLSLRG
ncbi:hypothetical protein CE91St17_10360 [Alistipes onderdonkii]|nr:hypothetical protein CE91St18_14930 [Alistipes onderdonkii]GKG95974.1 hypothetical protein CE91St17_10360 [Alistipes onderdonkii]